MLMSKKGFFTPSVCKARPFSVAKDYAHVCIEHKLITLLIPKLFTPEFNSQVEILSVTFTLFWQKL